MIEILKGKKIEEVLASILFVSGDGIEIKDIQEKLELKDKEMQNAIDKLKEKYSGDIGINVVTYRGKIQLCSNKQYAECVTEVLNPIKEKLLTRKALEVIAIIAYKQPITRLEIEQMRGINPEYSIQMLMQHNLIEVVGRKDAVGKPLLYGTTDEFLRRFGLESLEDLPDYEEVLDRIKVVHRDDNSLYRTFDIPDEEDGETLESEDENALPDFLEGEEDVRLVE